MAKITIDLDDRVAERLTAVSRARNLTVEEWLRERAEQAAEDFPLDNASHRAILASLDRPEGYFESPRDELYDRERDRADLYVERRRALLDLIDNTQGDMGGPSCIWRMHLAAQQALNGRSKA